MFSHTAPPICAKNLSNYLSSGKPYLITYLCLVLTDCSHCFLLIKKPDDLSAKLCVSHRGRVFFQTTSAQFVQFIHHCTVAHSPWALWGWACLLQHLARELLSLQGCRSLLGFPGALVIPIKKNKKKQTNCHLNRGNLWQWKALAEEPEATLLLIFKAGSVFLQNIKLLSQQKGKYLALALNCWRVLTVTQSQPLSCKHSIFNHI